MRMNPLIMEPAPPEPITPEVIQPLQPNTDAALESVGLLGPPKDLKSKLKANYLDTDSLFQSLSGMVHGSGSEAIRLSAIKTALELNPETRGAEKQKELPIINIVINGSRDFKVNPILIPREVALEQ